MSKYIICHARKIDTLVGMYNVAKHNSREKFYDFDGENGRVRTIGELPDWIVNPKAAVENFGDINHGTADQTIKRREEEILEANLKRKPQRNASVAVEFVFSASPEWLQKNQRSTPGFLNDCVEFVKSHYGHVIQVNAHFDEKSPHVHVLTVPILGQRYTSSEFLGGREGLRKLQTDIFNQVGKKYGLERGFEGSKARHDDQVGYTKKLKERVDAYQTALTNKGPLSPPSLYEKIIDPDKYLKKTQAFILGNEQRQRQLETTYQERAQQLDGRERQLHDQERLLQQKGQEWTDKFVDLRRELKQARLIAGQYTFQEKPETLAKTQAKIKQLHPEIKKVWDENHDQARTLD